VRKGKTDGASEEDMDTVIGIHNNMNETTWKQVRDPLHTIFSKGATPLSWEQILQCIR
jgi:Cytochrome c/c1 heme lyase